MTDKNRVVWSEGLFLRTQHFQQQDRHTDALVRGAMAAHPLQHFGFRRLELNRAALAAGQIAIDRADGILPDGTPFSIPADTPAPPALPLRKDSKAGLVMLVVPVEQAGATSIDPSHAEPSGARLRGITITARDAIRGGADPEEIEVAQLAMRLVAPGDEMAGHVGLPVARIDGLMADGGIAIADGYLAPALTIAAVPWYAGLLQELVTGLERIAEAHGGMVLGGAGRSVENLLILELANTSLPRLSHILTQNLCHPSELFGELAGLAGRMATYGSSSRRMNRLPDYDHADPAPAFADLADTLRSLILSLRHVEPKSRALQVARHAQNIWKVRIDNPEMLKSSRIVLRVGSDLSDESLRRIFVDQATVGSADSFERLWKSRLPGIALKPLHSQPREIPYDGERLCLELDQRSEHWSELLGAPGFIIGVSGQLEREPQIDCYAVMR